MVVEYYHLVKGLLDEGKDLVTVTGTEGVGKSLFDAYFFKRLRKEEPSTWIVAASSRFSVANNAVIFKDGDEVWNENELLILFYVTVSEHHPVNAYNILEMPRNLGLQESVKYNPKQLCLIHPAAAFDL
ncbi:hypothetical protein BBJ29_009707 [Phytophthora kernoviae]|uniref:Uncharacterized protein n=1 Tax=Phytophthora kernoviae TaxID=325452 RepID=A0A3R7IX66_9STRA|nr:hypothetical protein BBJ29_009707 [Phytophthora kernoviae]